MTEDDQKNNSNKKVKLSEIRKELKLTQAQMCEILGVDRGYLSKFENEKVSIEWVHKAVKLQKLLLHAGYSLEDLALPTEEN